MPLKQFQCIFPSKNQQNVKLLPEIVIFQELLIAETWHLWHWIWHALNPIYILLKPFQCIFPSQNQQNVKFWLFPTPPTKNEKCQFEQGKMFEQACICAHIGFWVCQLQCTMLELCMTSTFWVIMVFLHFFTGRFTHRVLKHCVVVEWDPRRTATWLPFHFDGVNLIWYYLFPKIVKFLATILIFQLPFIRD